VNQFLGRYLVHQLAKTRSDRLKLLPKLGDVFWYDQYRNLASAVKVVENESQAVSAEAGWRTGVDQLRDSLIGWWAHHTSSTGGNGRDYLIDLQNHFVRIFPGTLFRGVRQRDSVTAPRGVKDFYFLLERDGKVYDLAEMSSGEQAIFPLLYDFVRLDIGKSIVLIDELELHLHPPEQQGLLSALRVLGPDCQFIITTHSSAVAHAIPVEEKVRLEGGRRCL
jgi:hypothetical protein